MEKSNPNYFCWVVAYIDVNYIDRVKDQLAKNPEYAEVEAYIPTVKVLKKKFKGKHQFEEIPLLFNYGFFKIPRKFAIHPNYMDNMQKNISCIYGWLKDPLKLVRSYKKMVDEGRTISADANIPVATATPEEISELLKATINIGAHSADDINLIRPGDLITLRGYPWEGVEAEFVSIDEKKKEVRVKIFILGNFKEVPVAYDNVFFTIYHNNNYDDSKLIKDSLDAMDQKNTLEKLYHKNSKKEE